MYIFYDGLVLVSKSQANILNIRNHEDIHILFQVHSLLSIVYCGPSSAAQADWP